MDPTPKIIALITFVLVLNSFFAFLIGVLFYSLAILLIPLQLLFIYVVLSRFCYLTKSGNTISIRNRFQIWILLGLNLLFGFFIGYISPSLELLVRNYMAIVILLCLFFFNFLLIDRLSYFNKQMDQTNKRNIASSIINSNQSVEIRDTGINHKMQINFNNKAYYFSKVSIVVLILGVPITVILLNIFFRSEINYWLIEVNSKNLVYFLRVILNINSQLTVNLGEYHIFLPSNEHLFHMTPNCCAIEIFAIFIGLTLFVPHSKTSKTPEDILWRKSKTLFVSIFIISILNFFRLVLIFFLDYIGAPWGFSHDSTYYVFELMAAFTLLFLFWKWLPEFFISIYISLVYIKRKFFLLSSKGLESKD